MKSKLVRLVISIILSILLVSIFTGCSKDKTLISKDKALSASELLLKAKRKTEDLKTYYVEFITQVYTKDSLNKTDENKEWLVDDIKARTEQESEGKKGLNLYDGKKGVIYFSSDNTAITYSSVNGSKKQRYKEYVLSTIEKINDNYSIEKNEIEQINGIDTIHISAKKKEDSTDENLIEFWIDKNDYYVLSYSIQSGNYKYKWSVSKLELSPKTEESMFTLDLSNGVKVLMNIPEIKQQDKLSIEEASKMIGAKLLHFTEDEHIKLDNAEFVEDPTFGPKVRLTYTNKNNGSIMLEVTRSSAWNLFYEDRSNDIEVRAIKGHATGNNEDAWKQLMWKEGEFYYLMVVRSSKVTMDDATKLAERLDY